MFHVKQVKDLEMTVALRLREAIKRYELRTGEDLTWIELGRRVTRELGGNGAPDTSKFSRIKLDQQAPTLAEVAAFAVVLGVDPGWLAFGEGEMVRGESQSETVLGRKATPVR